MEIFIVIKQDLGNYLNAIFSKFFILYEWVTIRNFQNSFCEKPELFPNILIFPFS